MNQKAIAWLKKLHACGEAVEWASGQKSAAEAWKNCERGDWMLWLLGKLSGEPGNKKRKQLVLAACECARLSLKYVPKGEKRPLVAIQTAENWARGEATMEEVRAADAAAYAAAACAADAAARKKTLAKCADIVRKHYPKPPSIGGKA